METNLRPNEEFDVFNCDTKPVRGLVTSKHPLTIEEDEFSDITNARVISGDSGSIIQTRGGMTAVLSSISTTADYRGSWSGYMWGLNVLVVAVYDSSVSKTRVYYCTSPSGAWTEITQSSGKYGDTRLTNNAPVRFAPVIDPFVVPGQAGANALAFCDGGKIRVCRSGTAASTAIVYDVAPQTGVQNNPVRVRAIEFYYNLQGTPTITGWVSATDNTAQTDILLSTNGTDPNRQLRLTIGTGVDKGNATTCDLGFDLSSLYDSPQDRVLLVGVDTSYPQLWDNVALELRTATTGGTTKVIWDPTTPNLYAPPIPIGIDNSQRTIWAFRFKKETSGVTYAYTRFTWVAETNEAPSATQTADIFLFGLTYGSAAYSDYSVAVTSYNSGAMSESPGVIYSEYVTDRIRDYGGPMLDSVSLPRSSAIDCIFYAKCQYPASADIQTGVDTFNFYYRPPGSVNYRFAYSSTFTTYSGSWTVSDAGALKEVYAGPNYSYQAQSSAVVLPDAYHISGVDAVEIAWINDRIFAGQTSGSSSSVLASEYRHPFRFRRLTEFSNGSIAPDDPVVINLGNEAIKAIVQMSTSLIGVNTVYMMTDKGVYATAGSESNTIAKVSRVSAFGTVSPLSVAEINNKIMYLDSEMQVRELGGSASSVTRNIVDDLLNGIPTTRRKYVAAAAWGESYYLAFTPSGATTNTRILVWYDDDRRWSLDVPPVATNGIISWFDGSAKRLLTFGPNTTTATTLSVYEYDLSAQSLDLGTTAIQVTLTTKEWMSPSPSKWWHIGRIGLIADAIAGQSVAYTRSYASSASTATSSASLDVATAQAVVYDGAQTISSLGSGPTYKLSAVISSSAGKRIYRWWCERALRDRPSNAS